MVSREDVAEPRPRKRLDQRYQWLNHFNAVDLKIFARCWVAVWVMMLLVFIQPSLNHIGIATFLGAIVLFIAPPASTVLIYLLAALSLLLGMCLAWAWGLLTMKAALASRPDSETNAQLGQLQQQAVAAANQTGQTPAWEALVLVHKGAMLDTRVTVIYYVMGCVFIYAISRLRCANPKFTLTQIFGIIVTDIFMEVGPSLPNFMGSLASVLVKPGAIGIGIGTACAILLFPQSTSYMALGLMEKLTRMVDNTLMTTRKRLNNDSISAQEAKAIRARMIATLKAVQPYLAFLPLDLSRGVWNAEEVTSLQSRVRKLVFASLYLIDFHIGRLNADEMLKERAESASEDDDSSATKHEANQVGQRHRKEASKLLAALHRPDQHAIREETQRAMKDSTEDVLQLSSDAVKLAADCIKTANSCRWFGKPKPARFNELVEQLKDMREKLRVAREESISMSAERVLDAHGNLFDEKGMIKMGPNHEHPFLPSMVVAMVLEERICATATAIEHLLGKLDQLCTTRTTPRIWLPTRLQYAFSWLKSGSHEVPGAATGGETDPDFNKDPDEMFESTEEVRRRLEVSRVIRGSVRRNKLGRVLSAVYHWLTNPAGMYSLRMVIVTIALTIPSSLSSSANFFYREKGIWAVISAQTALLVYMSEFTFSLLARTLGTIIGGLMGMIAWYIGAGTGAGNPYGMAAITGVMLMPLIWWRLFLPPAFAYAIIMGGATFALVIGFSWDEGHILQYGLPGRGYVAFWKRVVTVLIGFLAAFIVQIFPKPPSATKHACKTLANSIRSLSDHYALLVSHWGRSDENSQALGSVSSQITLEVAEVLLSLDPTIANLKMELDSGPFDQKTLKESQEQCQYINQALGGLLQLASELPLEFQARLAQTTGIKDDRGIGDIMAVLGILEQALRTGSPLPERLPAPLVARAVETYLTLGDQDPTTYSAPAGDEHHRRYCVGVTLYLKFLTSVDDLLLVLKSALGERHVVYQWEEA